MARFQYLLLLFLAGTSIGNGLLIVLFPQKWYLCIANPERAAAYSQHFVTDVGTAYLTIGAALAWAALRPAFSFPLIVVALLFSSLHAAHHIYEYLTFGNPTRHVVIELFGIWAPAAAMSWAALYAKRQGG
jgi:hypothetical protein